MQDIDEQLQRKLTQSIQSCSSIQYSIASRSKVLLKVYDEVGNEVATLVNEEKERGVYKVTVDASNLASGLYFIVFKQTRS